MPAEGSSFSDEGAVSRVSHETVRKKKCDLRQKRSDGEECSLEVYGVYPEQIGRECLY